MSVHREPTLRERIRTRDNDYTAEEQAFFRATGQKLTRVSPDQTSRPKAPVSVVVPCYNGHRTLPYVVKFLNDQLYRNFELVVVDDGSTPPIAAELLLEHAGGVVLKHVRTHRNLGYSAARNVGIQCAEGEVLVLMDDDLRGPDSVTFSAALRHQHVEKMVFLGFREDAEWTAFAAEHCPEPALERDWRCLTEIKPEHVRLSVFNSQPRAGRIRIVEESAFLKKLGFGAALGCWDLPTLVSSHGLSLTRGDAIAAGGFVEHAGMNHWAVDDLSFGATMIAYGVKIAPALEWRCWHLKQEGREATRAQQFASFLSRWPHYLAYLDQRWPAQRFPLRQIRPTGRRCNLEQLEVA